WLIDLFPDDGVGSREVTWDARAERVTALESMTWAGLVLHATDAVEPPAAAASRVLAEAGIAAGPGAFAPREAFDRWIGRARFAASGGGPVPAPDAAPVRAATERLPRARTRA